MAEAICSKGAGRWVGGGGGGEDRESAGCTEKGERCGGRGERESVARMKASLLLSPRQVFCLRVS